MQEAHKEKGKTPKRSPAARSDDTIRVSANDGQSYAEILKAMKARLNPSDTGLETDHPKRRGRMRSFWS